MSPQTATVAARRAPSSPVRRAWFHENVMRSLWFLPLLFLFSAIVASRITLALDTTYGWSRPPDGLFPGDVFALDASLSTIAAAMLTFLGVVLSATLIAVQLASSQYSPRIVRTFVGSPMTKITIGLFLATFVFALHALIGSRQGGAGRVPALTLTITYLLILITLIVVVIYLHGIVKLLRVQHLLHRTEADTYAVLDREFPPHDAYSPALRPAPGARTRAVEFHGDSGTLQLIDLAALADELARADCWLEMQVAVGEHVGPHTLLGTLHGTDPGRITDGAVTRHFLFGNVRTLDQDPAFGIRLLVDAASRALSPAVNDPTTAVQALSSVVDLLARIVDRPDPTGWYTDSQGTVRLHLLDDSFERLAVLGLTEILRYGADAPQVTRRMAAAYDEIENLIGAGPAAAPRHRVVDRLRQQFAAAVHETGPFADVATVPDRMGLG